MEKRFRGIYAPLTTPFENDDISIGKFQENIHKYNEFSLSGYVVAGSTAESVYLSDDEVEELVRSAVEASGSDRQIIAGTARESTKITLEFSKRIAELGIDATLIRTPSYFKALMTQEALKKYYFTIADQSKVPLIIYHIPRYTGIYLSPELLTDLSKHQMIAGIKDSSGNMGFLDHVIPQLDKRFDFLLGAGSMIHPGLMMGSSGGVLALSDVAPAQCIQLYHLFLEKRWDEAKKLQHELVPLNQALTAEHGIPAIKFALDLIGFYGGPCRPPLLNLKDIDKKKIRDILVTLNLIA